MTKIKMAWRVGAGAFATRRPFPSGGVHRAARRSSGRCRNTHRRCGAGASTRRSHAPTGAASCRDSCRRSAHGRAKCLRQAFPVGDELRRLPGEHKAARGLLAPAAHRFERGRAIKRAIDLGARELRCIPGEPALLRHVFGIERTAPAIISPSRSADENLAHPDGLITGPPVPSGRPPNPSRLWNFCEFGAKGGMALSLWRRVAFLAKQAFGWRSASDSAGGRS